MKLLVVQPIGDRAVGSEITDADEAKAILASEQAHFVVQVAEDEAKPEADAKPGKATSSAS